MLKNKDERRKWIDNYEENYAVTFDNGSVRVLESNLLPDRTRIVVILIFTKRFRYDDKKRDYTHEKEWSVVDRYLKAQGDKVLIRKSLSELVEHLKRIKS